MKRKAFIDKPGRPTERTRWDTTLRFHQGTLRLGTVRRPGSLPRLAVSLKNKEPRHG